MENDTPQTPLAKAAPRITALNSLAAHFEMEPSRVMDVLKSTVIRGTKDYTPTNDEVAAFIVVANQYHLNPFTREIHAFADPQRGVCPVVGIDGWSHIVNGQPDYDGCQFDEHLDDEGRLVSMTCTIHHKSRTHPTQITEYMAECKRNTTPWNTYPHRMLRHKVFIQCARLAFSLSGIQDEDEAADTMGMTLTEVRGGRHRQEVGTLSTESLKPAAALTVETPALVVADMKAGEAPPPKPTGAKKAGKAQGQGSLL